MSTTPRSLAPYVLFFVSGISGLVYQVVWVRQFGNVFGNTVHSAALVTAVFMCGLGVGSYWAGRWADRRHARGPQLLLRAYGGSEVLIGVLGAALAFVLPHLAGFSARISTYAPAGRGWYELSLGSEVLRHAVAVALLAPITLLMGGTLTLLVRHLVAGELRRAGWRIGALYGFNTAGAALGCFLTDFTLVPSFGLLRTQLLAAGINLGVGAAAVGLAAPAGDSAAPAPETSEPAEGATPDASRHLVALTALAIALTGFAGMGLEIVWFRILTSAMGQYRAVFSLLLAVILVGIWAGSILGGYLHRRFGEPATSYLVVEVLFVVSTLALLATFDRTSVDRYFAQAFHALGSPGAGLPAASQCWAMVRAIALLVGLPAILMGCSFPLANAGIQRVSAQVGRRAGALYLANTAGSVLGSLLSGLVLIPRLGAQRSVFWLALAAGAAIVPLRLSTRTRQQGDRVAGAADYAFTAGFLVVAIALSSWALLLPDDHLRRRSLPEPAGERYLTIREGPNELLAVSVGSDGRRRLWTNGHAMSTNGPEAQRYMRAFAHLPLLQMEDPSAALVICFGVGNTLHAASLHPSLARLDVADLSRNVLEHASWFAATNGRVLEDPGVRVAVNDGRQHLRMEAPGVFDLVTLEPPPIGHAGVSSLYSKEFYELVRSRLRPGGYLTQWLPVEQLQGPASLALVRAFVDVFPTSVLLSGERRDLILMGTTGPSIELDPDALARRLRARPRVAEDLARIHLASPAEIAGTFVANADALRRATASVAPVTDDVPSMEYSVMSKLVATRIPRELFDPSGVASWCPRCVAAPAVPDLAAHLRVLGRLYADEAFLRYRSFAPAPVEVDLPALLEGDDGSVAGAIARSGYLQRVVGIDPHGQPMSLAPARLLALEGAMGHLERSDQAIAALRLGLAYRAASRGPDAEAALRRAVELDPASTPARFGLGSMLRLARQLDPAITEYRRGLALAPGDVPGRLGLVETLLAAGHADEASAELLHVLELDPENGRAHKIVCILLARAGRLDEARGACARAQAGGATIDPRLEEQLSRQ